MKKTMILLMAMGALDTTLATNSGQNLIVNGNFADSPCKGEVCIYNTLNTVKGWIPEPDIEVGNGFHYNQYLGNQRVLDLAPNSNACVKQIIKSLQPGVYQLTFEYAARSDRLSEDCQFEVSFNGKSLKRITPLGDRIQTDTIDIEVRNVCEGNVRFCGIGGENNIFGAVLKSVRLIPKNGLGINHLSNNPVPVFNPGSNVITNGRFTQNVCQNEVCIYTFGQFNRVKNWVPENDLEIGWGSHYNKNLGKERVLDLAPNSNSCVRQVIRYLQPGTYQLTYEYAARSDTRPSDCEFEVRFNDRTLKKVSPVNDRIQTDTIDVEVKSGTEGELRFCSVGQNNHLGAVLKSVSMARKNYNLEENSGTIELDSHSGKCLQKQYLFRGGQVQISFNYQVFSNTKVQHSAIILTLDGQPIYRVLPCDNGNTIKIQGQISSGVHTLGFCTFGSPVEAPHKVLISNLVIEQKQICVWGKDLIINGGFQQNSCHPNNDWCIWNQYTIGNNVPGWMPSPQIEVGKGFIYNKAAWDKVGSNWVSELDADTNTCIKQRIQGLKQGKHLLKFDWAAKVGFEASTSGGDVKVNGKVIKSIQAKNHEIQREKIEFFLNENPSDPWLEFCGTGNGDGYGLSIDNVQLFSSNC